MTQKSPHDQRKDNESMTEQKVLKFPVSSSSRLPISRSVTHGCIALDRKKRSRMLKKRKSKLIFVSGKKLPSKQLLDTPLFNSSETNKLEGTPNLSTKK
jgi:hypothetical protein